MYPFFGGILGRLSALQLSDNAQPFADAVQDVRELFRLIFLTVKIRISVEKDKSEPISNGEKVRIIFAWCTNRDSNPGPTGYEPVALTN